jgi:hypothetical protein
MRPSVVTRVGISVMVVFVSLTKAESFLRQFLSSEPLVFCSESLHHLDVMLVSIEDRSVEALELSGEARVLPKAETVDVLCDARAALKFLEVSECFCGIIICANS